MTVLFRKYIASPIGFNLPLSTVLNTLCFASTLFVLLRESLVTTPSAASNSYGMNNTSTESDIAVWSNFDFKALLYPSLTVLSHVSGLLFHALEESTKVMQSYDFLKLPEASADSVGEKEVVRSVENHFKDGKLCWSFQNYVDNDSKLMHPDVKKFYDGLLSDYKAQGLELRFLNMQNEGFARYFEITPQMMGIVFPRKSLLENAADYSSRLYHEGFHAKLQYPTKWGFITPTNETLYTTINLDLFRDLPNTMQHALFFKTIRESDLGPGLYAFKTRETVLKIDFYQKLSLVVSRDYFANLNQVFLEVVDYLVELSAPPKGFTNNDRAAVIASLKTALVKIFKREGIVNEVMRLASELVKECENKAAGKLPSASEFGTMLKDAFNKINKSFFKIGNGDHSIWVPKNDLIKDIEIRSAETDDHRFFAIIISPDYDRNPPRGEL